VILLFRVKSSVPRLIGDRLFREIVLQNSCGLSVFNAEVIIIDADPTNRLEQHLFWNSLLGKTVEVLSSLPDKNRGAASKDCKPEILVIGEITELKKKIDFIREISNTDCAPYILSVCKESSGAENVDALLAGADDAVRRPISLLELGLRLKARIPAAFEAISNLADVLNCDWELETFIAKQAGLSKTETKVARVLTQNAGQAVTRDDLAYAIDGYRWEHGNRKFDVHVSCLRRKFLAAFGSKISINTVRSGGYLMQFDDAFAATAN
jgi:DNA-binding response OmpR family regulator